MRRLIVGQSKPLDVGRVTERGFDTLQHDHTAQTAGQVGGTPGQLRRKQERTATQVVIAYRYVLIKLLHPDGEVTKEEVEEYLSYAMEMRRRVKEQLKKMGGLEYWDTSFSYIDKETGQESFVPVPEMGGGTIIAEGALPPGSVYTIGTNVSDGRIALFLLQTQMNRGSGRIVPLGNLSGKMKEALKPAMPAATPHRG